MRDKMERFVLLPFSVGCVSESSIAVAVHHPRRSSSTNSRPKNTSPTCGDREHDDNDDEVSLSSEEETIKNSSNKFPAISKPDISNGFNKLFKGFKNISQLFVYKEEMEEMDREMEIGFPTDVKHVTHIGLDGSNVTCNNNNPMRGWDSLMSPDLLRSIPSVSLEQFDLAMAAQAQAHPPSHPQMITS